MPKITEIRISFSKQANDANYGSETARCELMLTAGFEGEVLDGLHARQLLAQARAYVHQELAQSPNASVRRAVETHDVAKEIPTGENYAEDEDLPY